MRVADIILQQLGGGRFIAMTGSKNFISDGNTLRMSLAKNSSEANRLWITLDGDDTYTMRFFRYTPSRFDTKTCTFTEEVTEIKKISGVYCDQLQDIFTSTTGLYTRI